ncbi:biotin carboxylase N-terminal domain-containing protein [Noviherbaspirillum massiliense]|uniref:ATP-binding protein n=1 Tax=Noviherbaspirillum massiliense TaxID=1465823 RepID=UPI0002F363A7|nr:biotin carboxylase N-terminal domain-containing protein [Noviherbaspirillum massiliense]
MSAARFHSVLVANRGEIALRIMRTAHRLGYRTVAVYSDADRNAPHVRAAHTAVHIGAAPPAASYLNIPALLDAARRTGADAIHPGYGFLAENADFAQACADAGLVFIGPGADAIRAMGNKAGAKLLMRQAGVPCVPGYQGADQSDARMLEEAGLIGYPVMIKAAAGGGGRGMRRVDRADDFMPALRSARSEAASAFGSDELILEKAIVEPRHIEIQVFADMHGNAVHLGERDCSVQRRHQKLIEESPSPAVSAELRARMGQVSVAAAKAIGYVGAGTLEFLLGGDGNFHFMEMNTRLQVEHAVTEAVAGVDLVEWQLHVAQGATLPLAQAQIDARLASGGHAIEVRLCAEDPQQDFLPQSGTVAHWRPPTSLRCDHALEDGAAIPPYYDSMVAKVIAHGSDRADALRRLAHGLDECALLGVKNNRNFLSRCLRHAAFTAGQGTTAFIETHFPAAARTSAPDDTAPAIAAVLLALQKTAAVESRYPLELQGWSSSFSYPQPRTFMLDDAKIALQVTTLPGRSWQVEQEGKSTTMSATVLGAHETALVVDGRTRHAFHAGAGTTLHFALDGNEHAVIDLTYAPAAGDRRGAGSGQVVAPMNGQVVALHVEQGAQVKAGQVLLVIEAMKMEHGVLAEIDGQVGSLLVGVGDQVAPGRLLAEISPPQQTQ